MRAVLLSLLSLLALNGCVKRDEVLAEVWLESGIPAAQCTDAVKKSGVYRKLNDDQCEAHHQPHGCVELISYCSPAIRDSVRFNGTKFYQILNQELPKPDAN